MKHIKNYDALNETVFKSAKDEDIYNIIMILTSYDLGIDEKTKYQIAENIYKTLK